MMKKDGSGMIEISPVLKRGQFLISLIRRMPLITRQIKKSLSLNTVKRGGTKRFIRLQKIMMTKSRILHEADKECSYR
jgi:hypothetical protein